MGAEEAFVTANERRATLPVGLLNVTAIATGLRHSLAIGEVSGVCTTTGTSNADTLYGTSRDDTICGLRGNDSIYGRGGKDALFGNRGNDTLIGGVALDHLWGGHGNDTLRANDGSPGDYVNGGPEFDTCVIDKGDRPKRCDKIVVK